MGDVQRHRAEWPSKKRLYELYWGEGLSFPEVAETIGLCASAIRKICNKYGIPSRNAGSQHSAAAYADGWARTPLPSPYDAEWMYRRVQHDGMSMAAVARELDIHPHTVSRRLDEANLHPEDDKPWQDSEWLRQQFRCSQRTIVEVAESQGISGATVRYWMKKHDIQRPIKTVRESMQADGNEELSDAAKALDPTIKSKDTPDELINDTFAFGTNNAMGGRQGQR